MKDKQERHKLYNGIGNKIENGKHQYQTIKLGT